MTRPDSMPLILRGLTLEDAAACDAIVAGLPYREEDRALKAVLGRMLRETRGVPPAAD